MWPHDDGVQGVTLNLDTRRLRWYDNPGCACGDNAQEQTVEDFLISGPLYGSPPQDVIDEMRVVVEAIRQP
jgi:hypothetical protein